MKALIEQPIVARYLPVRVIKNTLQERDARITHWQVQHWVLRLR